MYTPSGLARPSPVSLDLIGAGRRAAARHGVAFTNEPSANGLHPWDLTLRSEGRGLERERLIKQTQNDLHDAVCLLHCVRIINTNVPSQAAALDRITGGFTIILHTHGAVVPPSPSSHASPEKMQFVAYLTRREVEQHAPEYHSPVARIAQLFAADVMPLHSTNYIARCIASGVDADISAPNLIQPDQSPLALIASPEAQSSQYIFNGYHPGHLEAFLLQERSSRSTLKKPGRFPLSTAVSTKPPTAAPSSKHLTAMFPPPYPYPIPLSSRAASSSPTRKVVAAQALTTAAMLEKDMRTLRMSTRYQAPAKATPVQAWQAAVPGAYPTGTPYSDDEESTNIIPSRTPQINLRSGTPAPDNRRLAQNKRIPRGRSLHLQGSLGVSTSDSISSASSFDWDNDGESVLPESVIAAVEREGM